MSAHSSEWSVLRGGMGKAAQVENPPQPERRRRARNDLHWSVLLFRNEPAGVVECVTRDLSSSGFYCVSDVAFTPGERLVCTLKIPAHDPVGKHLQPGLECKVRVVRVEPRTADGTFGLAFQIEDYHFIQFHAEPAKAEAQSV